KLSKKNFHTQFFIQPNNIDLAFLDYYKMIITTENKNYKMALKFCNNIEKLSNVVHLGEILSNTIKHKIFLNFLINKTMKHNQFQLDISHLIMNLPDEYEWTWNYSEKFNEFIASLNSNEIMILRVFRDLNYHYRINNDILYKLSEFIEEIIKIHKINNNLKLKEILLQLRDLPLSPVLPFSDKLTLSECLDFSQDFYNYLGIDNTKNINYIKNII
ncbi:hypothetical protein N5D16_12260, partial [Acinetobacter johnsonii]